MTAEEIRELRLSLGLTQGQLAEKIGVHRDTISYYERGVHSPSLLHAYRLEQLRKESDGIH